MSRYAARGRAHPISGGEREALVEMVAEGNDELLEEFFAEGTLPVERIVQGLRQAIRDLRIYPVLVSAAVTWLVVRSTVTSAWSW